MDGSVPSNPHLKWHIGNSLAYLFSWCVFTRKSAWRWDIGGKQANHQQSCLLIDPAKNLMINWFVFIQLSLSVLKLAGHNSMEWQERRLAVERLPCSGCITVCECCSAAPPNLIASLRRRRPWEFSQAAASISEFLLHLPSYLLCLVLVC